MGSMSGELGRPIALAAVKDAVRDSFAEVFARQFAAGVTSVRRGVGRADRAAAAVGSGRARAALAVKVVVAPSAIGTPNASGSAGGDRHLDRRRPTASRPRQLAGDT